jgi:sentrin-specific protease 8
VQRPRLSLHTWPADPSEAQLIFQALALHEKQLVVFAVNDNADVQQAAGGSHWSCLAFHRPSNTFRHYDSSRKHNSDTARELAGAATPLVRSRPSAQTSSGDSPPEAQHPTYVHVAGMPQQQNSYDCGLYMCAVAAALCALAQAQQHAEGGGGTGSSSGAGTAAAAAAAAVAAAARAAGLDKGYEAAERAALQGITPHSVAQLRQQMLALIESKAAAVAAGAATQRSATAVLCCLLCCSAQCSPSHATQRATHALRSLGVPHNNDTNSSRNAASQQLCLNGAVAASERLRQTGPTAGTLPLTAAAHHKTCLPAPTLQAQRLWLRCSRVRLQAAHSAPGACQRQR